MDGYDFYYEAKTEVNGFLQARRQTTLASLYIARGDTPTRKTAFWKKVVHFHFSETNYAFFFRLRILSICTLNLDWKPSLWAHNIKTTLYQL